MAGNKKSTEKDTQKSSSSREINDLLDAIIQEAQASQQYDAYFVTKAQELLDLDAECFQVIAKRFQKSGPHEREILLQVIRNFKGFEHIEYLQEFVKNESFLPRTGMAILDLFNRSDVMVESGLAGRLMDLDHMVQRIKQNIAMDNMDTGVVQDYLKQGSKEQHGILLQLIDENGKDVAVFIAGLFREDAKAGDRAVKMVAKHQDANAFAMLDEVYKRTAKKDIAKVLRKMGHALKQKGIEVEFSEKKTEQSAVFQTASLPKGRTFISKVDAEGYRLIFMLKPVSTYEVKIFNIMMNFSQGIHDIEVINALRKETHKFIDKLLSDKKTEFMEVEEQLGAYLVQEACTISQQQGAIVSANIEQWKSCYSEVLNTQKQPEIFNCISADSIGEADRSAEKIDTLLAGTDIGFWFVVSKDARESWEKMRGILESEIEIPEAQKQERIKEIQDAALKKYFTAENMMPVRRRLEETAYYLYCKDQQDNARTVLALAATFDEADSTPEDNVFCVKVIERAFSFFDEAYQSQQKQQQMAANNK